MELKGKIAIITGSSGQLGSRIAIELGKAGCDCVCHYHNNRQKADDVVREIQQAGQKAIAIGADLTDEKQIESLFEKASEIGTPAILINSASIFKRTKLDEVTFEEARHTLDLNLTAAIMTSQAFAKIIRAKFGKSEQVVGKIINMSAVEGIRPWARAVAYCSSKAGLIGATKSLARELAPGICVNSVAPGVVTWPEGISEEGKQRVLKHIPMGKVAKPEDVTAAIIFLLQNDYITGQVLNVDGGRVI
jgi:NAD(P)-dependent dehydrogenase (short-subunit alcohol dehydrogenase family)